MKLLNIFKKRATPSQAIAIDSLPDARWMDRDYKSFADEGYRKNVVAYRSINMVSQGTAAVRLSLKKRRPGAKADEEVFDHPLLDLLRKPNMVQDYQKMTESVIAYLMISGNSYIHAVGPSSGSAPKELWTLRPDRMGVIPGRFRIPSAYEYSHDSTKQRFVVDQLTGDSPILHVKTFNPLDDWLGMSPVEAAAKSVDQHNASSAWNLALLQNGARPSGAFVVSKENEPMSEEQVSHLQDEVNKQYSGKARVGRPMLLRGGLDWKEMSINPKDMDWIEGRSTSARDVALTYGVPPQLLGIPGDNTYSNYKEAKQAFYLDTVIPLARVWAFYLNNWLVPSFGDDSLYLEPDTNSIEALEPMRSEKFTQVSNAAFLTINEKRELLGYGRYVAGEDEADTLLVPAGLSPLDEVMGSIDVSTEDDESSTPQDTEDFTGEPPSDATSLTSELPSGATSVSDTALNGAQVTSLVDIVARVAAGELPRESAVQIIMVAFLLTEEEANRLVGEAGNGFVPTPTETAPPPADKPDDAPKHLYAMLDGKQVNLSSARARERYRSEIISRRQKLEARFQTQLKAVWKKEALMMADAVDGISVDLIEFVVEDVVSKNEPALEKVLRENIKRIMVQFGDQILDLPKCMPGLEIKADPKTRFESFLNQFIDNHVAERIQNLSKTTKRRVTRELRQVFGQGLSDGETSGELIGKVKEVYSGFNSSRAATVVRTETGIAQNESQRSAAKALGVPGLKKTWISPRLPTSRDEHVAMHEKSVGLNEKFEVSSDDGVDLMDGPGDPSAPADQVINCHCVNVFGGQST